MCTVTFIKSGDALILTSNRDESLKRALANIPEVYILNNKKILFPKDPRNGGTWIAINENKSVVILMNGASTKHTPKENYSKSRGLIVLELIQTDNIENNWEKIELTTIEPFTLVVFENNTLFQMQWDGEIKTKKELNMAYPYIWSSATLYTQMMKTEREKWFISFLNENKQISAKKILEFHTKTAPKNKEFGLLISRESNIVTQCVSQIIIAENVVFNYIDLINEKATTITL